MPADASPLGFCHGPAQPLLTVRRLRKAFAGGDLPAVEQVSFTLGEGELLALLGLSGCGKTTTLRMLGGFEVPDSGTVYLRDRDITHMPPERRGIGIVFQDYALFPNLTLLDNVRFGLRGMSRKASVARAGEMLELVGLGALAGRKPHELSGGQQQRAALARTLAVAPPVVLLDEPFSNLDAKMRVETRQEVRKLLKEAGSAAILVTHDQEEALALADRVAVMEAGRVVQIGTPDDTYLNPSSAFVASFIGRANILSGTAGGMMVDTAFGNLPLSRAANGAISFAVRPEQIMLEPDQNGSARVTGREFRGHDQLYWVQEHDGRQMLVISGPGARFDVGARVRLNICECVVPLG